MEWVETTGETVEEAKEKALDHLGVDESLAEFEVVEEPKSGFLRRRTEARVRARVRPERPRPKVDRRDRRRKRSGSTSGGGRRRNDSNAATPSGGRNARSGGKSSVRERSDTKGRRGDRGRGGGDGGRAEDTRRDDEDAVGPEKQAEAVADFLEGLVHMFGVEATVEREMVDEDTAEVKVHGDDLGLLIGPKGATLQAVQDLSRTVVQRRYQGRHDGRVRLDIGDYRQRRREALARFAEATAEDVLEKGKSRALEPMGASDRKVVHDTINEVDGVHTISEGEEPRRRVVIIPDED
ncbi:MAG: RNA-binding cell elongation regulator Jag/EloR [Actinomycetota bacterium]|nr:RNA-binding cell elongation regulator Jag/EloR [Actinomycetota bacterium]